MQKRLKGGFLNKKEREQGVKGKFAPFLLPRDRSRGVGGMALAAPDSIGPGGGGSQEGGEKGEGATGI